MVRRAEILTRGNRAEHCTAIGDVIPPIHNKQNKQNKSLTTNAKRQANGMNLSGGYISTSVVPRRRSKPESLHTLAYEL